MKGRLAVFLSVVLVLVVLVALNAASYVRVEPEAEREMTPDRSTANAGATGTRAFYEYLQQSGYRVVRWGQPVAALADEGASAPATFVIIGRLRRQLESKEAEALLRWVARGGRLVVIDRLPDEHLLQREADWRLSAELDQYPGPDVRPEDVENMTRGVPPIAPAQPTLLTRDVAQVTRSRFAGHLRVYSAELAPTRAARTRTTPVPDDAAEDEDEEEAPPTPARQAPSADADEAGVSPAPVEHLSDGTDGGGALLVDYAYGRGRVVLLSDPFIISNAGLRLADNLMLATNLVGAADGLIAFDEYHQGYGSARNRLLAYFAGTPVLWMFAQALVVILALLWTSGRRFARPLPAPHVDRRSKLEFVASMAELQQRARAYDLAIENVYGRTRRALARYGGTGPNAPAADIAARVAARAGRDPRDIERLMRDCEDAMAGAPTGARRALQLVADLRALERELGIRMRAREIQQAENSRQ